MTVPVTIRGQAGFLALGGILLGSPVIGAMVAPSGTSVTLGAALGSVLAGALVQGDVFTVAGVAGTYTVTAPTGQRVTFAHSDTLGPISFTPGAAGSGFPSGAAVTLQERAFALIRDYSFTPTLDTLDTSVMRNPARTSRTGLYSWQVQAEGLLNYADVGQAAFLDLLLTPPIGDSVVAFVMLGYDELPVPGLTPFLLAESALVERAVITGNAGMVFTVAFTLRNREGGYRPPSFGAAAWQESWDYTNTWSPTPVWVEGWDVSQDWDTDHPLWVEGWES